jgi:hypothetical protein
MELDPQDLRDMGIPEDADYIAIDVDRWVFWVIVGGAFLYVAWLALPW